MEILYKLAPALDVTLAAGGTVQSIEDSGYVAAIVADLSGAPDREGDAYTPLSVVDGSPVVLSDYGHSAYLKERPPVGKGGLYVEGSSLVFKGQYFMAARAGRDAFEVIKALGGETRWSWVFGVLEKRNPLPSEVERGIKRMITRTAPIEVSPVLRPAAYHSRTLSTKRDTDEEIERRIQADVGRIFDDFRASRERWARRGVR